MRVVFEVKPAFVSKAQELLGKDDVVGRQSVYTRSPTSLGMGGEFMYLILDGSEPAIRKAEELLKGMAALAKNAKEVLEKFDEIENAAASGFGALGI